MDVAIMAAYAVALLFSRGIGAFALVIGLVAIVTASAIADTAFIANDYLAFHCAMFLVSFGWVIMLRFVPDLIIRAPVVCMMLLSTLSFASGQFGGGEETIIYHAYPLAVVAMHLAYIMRSLSLRADNVGCWSFADAFRVFSRALADLFVHRGG